MIWLWWITGLLLAAVWLKQMVEGAIGSERMNDVARPEWDLRPDPEPRLLIVVPARNEEQAAEEAVGSLLWLEYANYEVIAVNDRSTDATGAILNRLAAEAGSRMRVIHVAELPEGWLGKTHAMWKAAEQSASEWILFTDADVTFRPDALRRAIAFCERKGIDHLVVFPQMVTKTFGESMMIGIFQTMFSFAQRPWKVSDPNAPDFTGMGAFNLVRRSAYEAIGTYKALRLEVIDDMMLGRALKERRFRQENVFGPGLLRLRWAIGASGFVHNLTKNFFALLDYRPWRVVAGAAGLACLNLLPFVGLVLAPGWAKAPFAAVIFAIFMFYVGMWRRGSISPLYFFVHPVGSVMLIYTLLRSAVLTMKRGGVEWRGTTYPLDMLRRK